MDIDSGSVHRLQVCLPESQVQYLTHRARKEGVSIAELIRRLVDDASKSTTEHGLDSLWEIAGIGEEREPLIGSIPVSEKPDIYIAASLKRPLQRKPGPKKRKSR